jgi:hypothetical protein
MIGWVSPRRFVSAVANGMRRSPLLGAASVGHERRAEKRLWMMEGIGTGDSAREPRIAATA